MKTKLDETNLAIIKALRNGRASFRDIAADLGLSEVTVRTRAARLIEDGVLDICGQVDVEKLPGHTLALVAIKLRSPDLVGEGEVFSHLRGVVSVAVLTGRHDLILTVRSSACWISTPTSSPSVTTGCLPSKPLSSIRDSA